MTVAKRTYPIIRPTQSLWKAWGGRGRLPSLESPLHESRAQPNKLCNWFAREVTPLRKPMILTAEASTMLTLLLPLEELSMAMVAFREALQRELQRLEIPAAEIASEAKALEDITIAKNNDRSTMGSLTQLASDLEYRVDYNLERGREVDLQDLQNALNRTLM